MVGEDLGRMPVVARDSRRLVGLIARKDLLRMRHATATLVSASPPELNTASASEAQRAGLEAKRSVPVPSTTSIARSPPEPSRSESTSL